MHTYTMNNGDKIKARDAAALVSKMRKLDAMRGSDHAYMVEVAKRVKMQDANARIPTNTAEAFVEALLKVGFIKGVETNNA